MKIKFWQKKNHPYKRPAHIQLEDIIAGNFSADLQATTKTLAKLKTKDSIEIILADLEHLASHQCDLDPNYIFMLFQALLEDINHVKSIKHLHEDFANIYRLQILTIIKNKPREHCDKISSLCQAFIFHRLCVETYVYQVKPHHCEWEELLTLIGLLDIDKAMLEHCKKSRAQIELTDEHEDYLDDWATNTQSYFTKNSPCCFCLS